jgi:hypothetical protein
MSGRGNRLPTLSWPLAPTRMTEPAVAMLPFCATAASARSACPPTTIAAANNQTLGNARLFMMISLQKRTGPCVVRISETHDSRARERWRH